MSRPFLFLLPVLVLGGCSVKDVKPWEKEDLASPRMQRDGGNKLMRQYQEHIYFSKEGTKGGIGVAGGGCGCN